MGAAAPEVRLVVAVIRKAYLVVLAALLVGGCATSQLNYSSTEGPRYAGALPALPAETPETLQIASFNIAFAVHLDSALLVLQQTAQLRDAHVLLLQEMDAAGTKRIADALGMAYVYYPATLHPKTGRDFGNAVLARFPIVADSKILLPHVARFRKTQRAATAATLQVGEKQVRVYSVHLGTMADVSAGSRRDQLVIVLKDAASYDRVIIGGDLNNRSVGHVARAAGYEWPTENGPDTVHLWRWDHIFVRGLGIPDSLASGTVMNVHHASDHRPIWVHVLLQ